MEKEDKYFDLENIEEIAGDIINKYPGERIFALYGSMGAGKTTLIKSLCKVLGSQDNVKSPTFSIINEYLTDEIPIYHFDFYRIKESSEALDIGIYDYFSSGSYCFIEWPEKIEELLPENFVYISLKDNKKDTSRLLHHKVIH